SCSRPTTISAGRSCRVGSGSDRGDTVTQFVNLTIAGLTIGAVYALVSLGVVVIYRISRVVNLAHGAMGIFTTFVFHYEFNQRLGWPVGVSFAATLAVGAVLGVVVERLLVGP